MGQPNEMETGFKVQSFCRLLNKKFNIPSYQRGYRWEGRQVTELLDDLKEFIDSNESETQGGVEKEQFYCLQPIVVRRNPQQPDVYDVIDGQQRLTTIYLIIQYLWFMQQTIPNIYSIEYDRHRQEDERYLSENKFLCDSEENYTENADNFYIYKAYQTIATWFENQDSKYLAEFVQILTVDSNKKDVRIIWYELPQDNSDMQAIESFTRLNEGKIPLTNAELVKALLLQCANEDKVQQEVAMRHAMEWDTIEKQLQNPLFWGMLSSGKYNPPSHIELVIDFVAQSIVAKDEDDYPYRKDKDLYSFLVINKAIADKKETVETIWEKILDTFTIFRNWYDELDIYHLVGLFNLLNSDKTTLKNVQELYNLFVANTKTKVIDILRKKIGEKIKVDKSKDEVDKLEEINYIDNPKKIIAILEAFNVYEHLSRKNSTDHFRFDLFKKYNVTSLEHIHPQNLDTDSMPPEDFSSWLNARKKAIEDCNNEEVKDAANKIEGILKENKKEDRPKIIELAKKIDTVFDELAGMKPEQMHTLYNMALVDKDTNAALSNGFMYEKRNVLRQREKDNKTYIPIGTWAAFNKSYSPDVIDMKFWSPEDREAYYAAIEKAYNYFLND